MKSTKLGCRPAGPVAGCDGECTECENSSNISRWDKTGQSLKTPFDHNRCMP